MPATQRFNDRADAYHTHRPRYSAELITLLHERCGLKPHSDIADIGSGTGILSELFLHHGHTLFAVEPNAAMRAIAERNLGTNPHFHSIAAPAEATTLPPQSVDFVVVGQAFHWFDRAQAETEFARILRPNGWVILVWNERRVDSSPFAAAYEEMLTECSIDYNTVDPKKVSGDRESLDSFFRHRGDFASFHHSVTHDFESLSGLVASASYAPLPGHPRYDAMMAQLRRVFLDHQDDGIVTIDYMMKVYFGRVRDPSHQ